MSGLDLRLYEKILDAASQVMADRMEQLTRGIAADYTDYRYRVGYLAGMHDLLKIAKEAQEEILGIERKER